MPFYSDETIRQLKEATDISLVIEQFVPLKKASGGKFLGLCPFHNDSSPSMNVNPNMGIYKCFACGAGGDAFKFVMEHEKMDFRAAVEFVANAVGFILPKLSQVQDENYEEKDLMRKLNELASNWFKEQLLKSDSAKSYLEKRGISEKARDLFGLGLAPPIGFLEFACKNGFKPEFIVKAGLASEKDGRAVDKFRDRLMIPICSLSGAIVGFGGRDLSGNSPAKYMNSPETPVYNKSEILFGLNQSRKAISKENAVILVEGYFDVISLFQSGIENVVAISGIALSETQAKLIARYTKNAYISLDGDDAGQTATERCIEVLLTQSFSASIVNLISESGEKIDPDILVMRGGADAFKKLQTNAKNWLNYLADKANLSNPDEKANFVLKTKKLIASMSNAELKNQYLNLLSERFGSSKSLPVLQAKKTLLVPAKEEEAQNESSPEIPWKSLPSDELWLVSVIFRNALIQELAIQICDPSLLSSVWLAELLDYGYALFEESSKIDLKILYNKLPPLHRELLTRLPEKPWTSEGAIMDFSSAVLKLRISRLKAQLKTSRHDFELYKEVQGKIKACEDLAMRAKDGENVLNFLNDSQN
ncbi:MAG: DNA primase [Fibromonadaceae bacterium]|jgi:DNA primase|nr:DNA primase [Fibromonadaceae bacterium]